MFKTCTSCYFALHNTQSLKSSIICGRLRVNKDERQNVHFFTRYYRSQSSEAQIDNTDTYLRPFTYFEEIEKKHKFVKIIKITRQRDLSEKSRSPFGT